MIKVGIKGRVLKGRGAPLTEVLVEKSKESRVGAYYIYIWPNDGTKWLGTDKDMVYDDWLQDWECVEDFFKDEGWEVEWYDEKKPLEQTLLENTNPPTS